MWTIKYPLVSEIYLKIFGRLDQIDNIVYVIEKKK